MMLFRLPLLWSVAVLAIGISTGTAQTSGSAPQNASRAAPGHAARGNNVRPNNSNPQYFPRGPVNVGRPTAGPFPNQIQSQPPANFRPNYARYNRQLNHKLTTITPRQDLAAVNSAQPTNDELAKNDVLENQLPLAKGAPNVVTNTQRDRKIQEEIPDRLTPREERQTRERGKWQSENATNHRNYFDALRTHRHEWHDREWWKRNCNTIVFVTGGYYFLDASYWYPAWGYDPTNSYYDYDGPIYTYGNLLPDQVIANVQAGLQDAGYYFGAITGSLSVETRAALMNYQREQGLIVTGAIDEPTVESLGLY